MFVHQIEADDTLSWVNEAWLQFARENQASHLNLETILGRPLWDFITEATTRHFYQIIVQRARALTRVVTLHYRCDSPEKRRFMRMEIHPMGQGRIQFRNWILREELRPALELVSHQSSAGPRLITMCSWCKRIKNPMNNSWEELEDAIRQMQLFKYDKPSPITHGICPECEKTLEAEMESLG